MSNTYTITIQNNSGVLKNYAIFTGQPEITGEVQGKIWSNVFATAPTPDGNTAKFVIYKNFAALQGTSSGNPKSGVTVSVSGTKPVTLGKINDDNSITPGQSVSFITNKISSSDGGSLLVPSFAKDYLTPGGVANSFEIQTASSFTPDDAQSGNWLVGVSASINGASGPAATFIPIPGQSYQVKPINEFWLSAGQYVPGALVDYTVVQQSPLKLDFSAKGAKSSANVNNTPEGKFVLTS